MSIWGEIKHAVNSTLGNTDFKPLDKIFDECCGVFESDNVLHNVGYVYENVFTSPKILKMTGTIKIIASLSAGDSLSVYINGAHVGNVTHQSPQAGHSYPIINVSYGNEIQFRGSGGAAQNVQICGTTYFMPRGGIIE